MSVAKLTRGITLLTLGLTLAACASAPSTTSAVPRAANTGLEKSALELINEAPTMNMNSKNACAAMHRTLVCETTGFSRDRMDRCSCMDPSEIRTLFLR